MVASWRWERSRRVRKRICEWNDQARIAVEVGQDRDFPPTGSNGAKEVAWSTAAPESFADADVTGEGRDEAFRGERSRDDVRHHGGSPSLDDSLDVIQIGLELIGAERRLAGRQAKPERPTFRLGLRKPSGRGIVLGAEAPPPKRCKERPDRRLGLARLDEG